MAKSLGTLISECRLALGDTNPAAYVFSSDQLTLWINLALRDLSLHFPVRKSLTLEAEAGVHVYDLEADCQSVISVEYPAGEAPPCFLERMPHTAAEFWLGEAHWDFMARQDADEENPPQVTLSAAPAGGETIAVEYWAHHAALADPGDETWLPERLAGLIPLFVRWQAAAELAMAESMDPDPYQALAATLDLNAYRAERAYRASLEAAKRALSESAVTPWRMDGRDRVY